MSGPGVHIFVFGRVQGVGYRAWFAETAEAAGLTGWVRNRRNGRVEAFIRGEAAAVASVLAGARKGPPQAAVSEIEAHEVRGDPKNLAATHGITVLPTV